MFIFKITWKAKEKLMRTFSSEKIEDPVVSVFLGTVKTESETNSVVKEKQINFGFYKNNYFSNEDVFEVDGIKFLHNKEVSNLYRDGGILDLDQDDTFVIQQSNKE